jgi:hypothetical protein
MVGTNDDSLKDEHRLCITCGICCTGHLFTYAVLEKDETGQALELGMSIVDLQAENLKYYLPCHLWDRMCTVYNHPLKPAVCGRYQCKLLKELLAGTTDLEQALSVVDRTRNLIRELEALIPPIEAGGSFRKHLFGYIKQLEEDPTSSSSDRLTRIKSGALFVTYDKYFGVAHFFEGQAQMSADKTDTVNAPDADIPSPAGVGA